MKILLMGNPNVGKSALFNRLTGADVIISNYPGTTVEFTRGTLKLGSERIEELLRKYSLKFLHTDFLISVAWSKR
jgi:ferrous iron transport protein B